MPTILVADDDPNLRALIRATLEGGGRTVVEAPDGAVALQLARANVPDLAVLDWMMPALTGLTVARILRREPATASLPIIMLTAKTAASDIQQAREAGVDAYLAKPFSPTDLTKRVESLLERRHRAPEP